MASFWGENTKKHGAEPYRSAPLSTHRPPSSLRPRRIRLEPTPVVFESPPLCLNRRCCVPACPPARLAPSPSHLARPRPRLARLRLTRLRRRCLDRCSSFLVILVLALVHLAPMVGCDIDGGTGGCVMAKGVIGAVRLVDGPYASLFDTCRR